MTVLVVIAAILFLIGRWGWNHDFRTRAEVLTSIRDMECENKWLDARNAAYQRGSIPWGEQTRSP